MSTKPPADPTKHSVLTSDVINEAEATFKTFANKDGLVSQLDVIAIVRSMGMNPNDDDLTELIDAMQIRDPEREKQERFERDERERKERERKEKEKADAAAGGGKDKGKAPPPKKGKEAEGDGAIVKWVPPEKRPVVDWSCFISHVEPFYKDNRIEEEEIMRAFRVFDPEGRGWCTRDELVKIMTAKGEDILAPPEVAILLETFPNKRIYFREFAQKMQGTWVEGSAPPPEDTARTSTAPTAVDGAATARTEGGASTAADPAAASTAESAGSG
mmetsp:Transcript_52671/g.94006  ORF Transcript_52671/g.94006 Transcript_52671/m.94006 type:complete len:273 (-) Transcript_52671:611-1429(-)